MIPKLLHRIWFGPADIPDRYQRYWKQWQEHHPGWELHSWSYDNLPRLFNQELFDSCGQTWGALGGAAKQSTSRQVQQADIAAYEIVWRHGGVYLNCDLEPLKPIDPLCQVEAFAGRSPHPDYLSNAVIAGTKHNRFWRQLIDRLPTFVAMNPTRPINQQTGPFLLTDSAARYPGLTVYPTETFFPYSYDEMEKEGTLFPDSYTEHHWGHRTDDHDLFGETLDPVKPGWIK